VCQIYRVPSNISLEHIELGYGLDWFSFCLVTWLYVK